MLTAARARAAASPSAQAETAFDTSEGYPRLEMSFGTTADIRLVEDTSGQPVLARIEKSVTYWLVPPAAQDAQGQ